MTRLPDYMKPVIDMWADTTMTMREIGEKTGNTEHQVRHIIRAARAAGRVRALPRNGTGSVSQRSSCVAPVTEYEVAIDNKFVADRERAAFEQEREFFHALVNEYRHPRNNPSLWAGRIIPRLAHLIESVKPRARSMEAA